MLTAQNFNRLTNPEKYYILENEGVYLDVYRIDGPFKVALFSLHDCYCEVWLNQKTDQLSKAVAFRSYKKLDPFLLSVDINEVYSALY